MKIYQIINQAIKFLINKRITSANLDAEILLAHVLKTSREVVIAHPEKQLTKQQIKKFQLLILRRGRYEPIAYLVGYKFFYGLKIKVSPQVLIPRFETEQLVDLVRLYLEENNFNHQITTILDIGTGSGAISLALKKYLPTYKIYGLELSDEAIKLAKNNSKNLHLKIIFKKSDLLSNFTSNLKNAIIVANLPYLDKKQLKDLPPEIKKGLYYEPATALFAGQHGLACYQKLFNQISSYQNYPQSIFIEINNIFWQDFFALSKKYFPQQKINLIKDIFKQPRFIKIVF